MKYFQAYIACFLLMLLSGSPVSAQELEEEQLQRFDNAGSVHEYRVQDQQEKKKVRKSKSFRGYMQMRPQFVALCKGLHRDGRDHLIENLIYEHQQKRDDCIACKPFMKTFYSACKLGVKKAKKKKPKTKKKKSKKEEDKEKEELAKAEKEKEEQAHVFFKQRTPNPQVLSMLLEIFGEIVNEPKMAEESFLAVEYFINILSNYQGGTKSEYEYIDSLIRYISAHFEEIKYLKTEEERIEVQKETSLSEGWMIQGY